MTNKILIATNNSHKQKKLSLIVKKYFKQIDLLDKSSLKEKGNTFEEIARNKALAASKNYDGFVITTDAGMEIPALKNWNSLLTKRFAGKNVNDFERMDALLEMAKELTDRKMFWREAVAIAYKNKIVFSTTVEGAKGILQKSCDKSKYKKGIWLCSLWYFPTYKRNYFDLKPRQVTFAEVSWLRIKNEVERFFQVPYEMRQLQKRWVREVKLAEAYTLDNWPHDSFMDDLKIKVKNRIDIDILWDINDLRYQVLFRLTTYPKNKITDELIDQVITEQTEVIKLRINNTTLPLKDILKPKHKIFNESDWFIERSNGNILAIKNGSKAIELEFKEVNAEYAKELHNVLHYIHCARVDRAFGLYIKGEAIPFSVLGIQLIDRDYKRQAVLLKGFDYTKVVDFTRLYNFPRSPMNTSSVMFGLTRDYLRKNTDIQATISAFMPSYATGMSMFAGGLDEVIISKPLKHTFEKISDTNLYHHVVKRKENPNNHLIYSVVKLLPTLELVAKIKEPPLQPAKEINNKMLLL